MPHRQAGDGPAAATSAWWFLGACPRKGPPRVAFQVTDRLDSTIASAATSGWIHPDTASGTASPL